jgi:hypothetical protein
MSSQQEDLNRRNIQLMGSTTEFILKLLEKLSKGKEAVPEVIRKSSEKANAVTQSANSLLTNTRDRVQNVVEVVRTQSNEARQEIGNGFDAVKNAATGVQQSAAAVVEVVRTGGKKEEISPQLSADSLQQAFADIEPDLLESNTPDNSPSGAANTTKPQLSQLEIESRLIGQKEIAYAKKLSAPSISNQSSSQDLLPSESIPLAKNQTTANQQPPDPTIPTGIDKAPKERRPTGAISEPIVDVNPSETILYGTKDGEVFSNLTAADAIATQKLMQGAVGDVVPGAENLLIRVNGKTLFEADEQGRVTTNIYQQEPGLLNDREAIQMLGLDGLSSHLKFMSQTQGQAPEVAQKSPELAAVEKSLDDVRATSSAAEQDIPQVNSAKPDQSVSSQVGLVQSVAILQAYMEQIIDPALAESGQKDSGRVGVGNGCEIIKEQSADGYDVSLDRNDGSDPMILGSYSEGAGMAASQAFLESEYPDAMAQSISKAENQEISVTPTAEITPEVDVSLDNDMSQDQD